MTPSELCNRLKAVAVQWRVGQRVWHRADGKRGVIVEYCIDGSGCVMLNVCFGAHEPWDKCLPDVLSTTPIGDGSAGDEWKDGEEVKL